MCCMRSHDIGTNQIAVTFSLVFWCIVIAIVHCSLMGLSFSPRIQKKLWEVVLTCLKLRFTQGDVCNWSPHACSTS